MLNTYKLFRHNGNLETVMDLSEEDMEWIFNSLRLMQERQQELARENDGRIITASEIGEGSSTPDMSIDIGKAMYQEQYHDVTNLRERFVELAGRDLTDG
jgi:hypothetical protein